MSETPRRFWPYPYSSDLVADGALNIEQLGEAIEDSVSVPTNALTIDTAFNAYPLGISLMGVSGTDGNWPTGYGHVVTIRYGSGYAHQFWMRYTTNPTTSQQYWVRQGWLVSGTPTWSGWDTIVGPGNPTAQASGWVTPTSKANDIVTTKVTFPSGRFATTPRVFVQYRGTAPQDVMLSVADSNEVYFNLCMYRRTSVVTYVSWQAILGGN